jgi:AcrR family transcriptional regulator
MMTSTKKGRRPRASGSSYQTGRETREAIVTAAATVLVECGHAEFTLKRVADEVGISVGNLNYHFPVRDALLETLIDRTLGEYSRRFSDWMTGRVGSEKKVLGDLLEWVIDDATTPRYTHLFRELWAMSLHSRRIAKALDHFYDRSIEDVVELIHLSNLDSKRRDLRCIVELICVMSEGFMAVFGHRQFSASSLKEVKRLARRSIEGLVDSRTEGRRHELVDDRAATS